MVAQSFANGYFLTILMCMVLIPSALPASLSEIETDFSRCTFTEQSCSDAILKHIEEEDVPVMAVNLIQKKPHTDAMAGLDQSDLNVRHKIQKKRLGDIKESGLQSSQKARMHQHIHRKRNHRESRTDKLGNKTGLEWVAFVVSLQRRSDRLRGFMKAVAEQEPWLVDHLRLLPAIDGKLVAVNTTLQQMLVSAERISEKTLEEALEEVHGASIWDNVSPGAVGLYLSHALAWKRFLDDPNWDMALVFEDDLRYFSKHFEQQVRRGLLEKRGRQLLNDVDLAYLQHCDTSSNWPRGSPVVPAQEPVAVELNQEVIVPCTAAYAVSRRGAKQLLMKSFPMKEQLDRALMGDVVQGLRRIRFEPALAQVGEASFDSDVQETLQQESVQQTHQQSLQEQEQLYSNSSSSTIVIDGSNETEVNSTTTGTMSTTTGTTSTATGTATSETASTSTGTVTTTRMLTVEEWESDMIYDDQERLISKDQERFLIPPL